MIWFCPRALTTMPAVPVGKPSFTAAHQSIPSAAWNARASSPKASRPTPPMKATRPPARAAATAWLEPLPPCAVMNLPTTVSPGRGNSAHWNTRSCM